MSSIDNLTAKILADSEAEAAAITEKAQEEAAAIRAAAEAECERERERLLADAEVEAARQAERKIAGGQLAARDEALAARQQMLDRVFREALEQLNGMDKAAFTAFLVRSLRAVGADGGELVLPARYGFTAEEINKAMGTADSKSGGFRIAPADRSITGGFVLCQGGIEQNNTFEALVQFYRYELESEVLRALE